MQNSAERVAERSLQGGLGLQDGKEASCSQYMKEMVFLLRVEGNPAKGESLKIQKRSCLSTLKETEVRSKMHNNFS